MRAVLLSLVLALGAGFAHAETVAYPAARLTVEVPTGWQYRFDTNNPQGPSLQVIPPGANALFAFHVVPGGLRMAADYQALSLKMLMKQAEMSAPQKRVINGMDAISTDGTALVQGKPVEVGTLIVPRTPQRTLVFVGVMPKAETKKYAAGLTELLGGLRPDPAKVKPSRQPGRQ